MKWFSASETQALLQLVRRELDRTPPTGKYAKRKIDTLERLKEKLS